MKKITVFVNIREEDAIRAGLDNFGFSEVVIQPSQLTDRQRMMLLEKLSNTFEKMKNAQGENLPYFSANGLVEATQEQVKILLDEMADKKKEKQRKFDADVMEAIESILAAPLDDLISSSNLEPINLMYSRFNKTYSPDVPIKIMDDERIQLRWSEVKERSEEMKAKKNVEEARLREIRLEAEAKKKREDEAAAARLQVQLQTWIREKSTPVQKKRYERGLLVKDEIIDGIRNEAFSPLDGFTRYARISNQDVIDNYSDIDQFADDNDVVFIVGDAESITDEQMESVMAMEKLMDGHECRTEVRLHTGALRSSSADEDEEHAVRRLSVRVTAIVGEITLSREYALD